jgi:hypothetical protein
MYLIRLEINESEVKKNEGTYVLSVKNQGGEAVCSIQVSIKRKFNYMI